MVQLELGFIHRLVQLKSGQNFQFVNSSHFPSVSMPSKVRIASWICNQWMSSNRKSMFNDCQSYQLRSVFLLHCREVIENSYLLSNNFCLTKIELQMKEFCNYFKGIFIQLSVLPMIRTILIIFAIYLQFLNCQDNHILQSEHNPLKL